jgi:tRNA (guanine37-N1)-methyltransferase
MVFDILTVFPEMIEGFRTTGVIGKAVEKCLIEINLINIRDFSED